jgi:outer membrane protein assembly factor BamB
MVGGGPLHQSRNLQQRKSDPITQSWDFQADGVVRGSCVVAGDGTIYFVTTPTDAIRSPAQLYALSQDGRQKWKMAAQASYQASPAIASDGTVYVADDSNLEAITPNGGVKWRLPLGATLLGSPTIGLDGTIYVTTTQETTRGTISAISPEGSIRWTSQDFSQSNRSSSPAILPDGTLVTMQVSVYVGTIDGYSLKDGSHLFSQPHGYVDPYNVFPVIGQNGAIYVSTDDGVQVFDSAGQPSRAALSSGNGDLPAAVGGDGTVYTAAAAVEAIHPDGSRAWSLNDVPAWTFAIGANGMIFAAGAQQLYAITPDGTLVRTFNDLGSQITSFLALDSNDTVVFGTEDGKVHARSL